ncbi:hypothetical protein DL771_010520 [Monosporascus sp. 5C6A]|nr:hypothetical protein DL771_010520 [Monosporascus sp. 5C6A]
MAQRGRIGIGAIVRGTEIGERHLRGEGAQTEEDGGGAENPGQAGAQLAALHAADPDPQRGPDHDAGGDAVPRGLPEEGPHYQRLRGAPGTRDDNREAARQQRGTDQQGRLRRVDSQGVAQRELGDGGVAVRQREDDLAGRADEDEDNLGQQVQQFGRHALRDEGGRSPSFVREPHLRRSVAGGAHRPPASDGPKLQHRIE